MFSSKKTKSIQSNTIGVGLDEHLDIMHRVMAGELDPTSGEATSALGISGYDAAAIENDPELQRELESICKDGSLGGGGDVKNMSGILGPKFSKNTDWSCEIEDDDEADLSAQLAALTDDTDIDNEDKEENEATFGLAQESFVDEVDNMATTTSAFDGDKDEEEDHGSLGEEWKKGGKAATSTGDHNEAGLLQRRVEVMKQEAHALFCSGDKKRALTKLRECKVIEHELAVERALNTAQGLAAPPIVSPSSPPEKITTTKKVLSGQPSSSNSASEQHNIQEHQDEQKQKQQPQSGQQSATLTSRELKITAMRMHRAGNKAKAIALLKQAKSIENRLLAQDTSEKDFPDELSSRCPDGVSSLNRSIFSSTSGRRVRTNRKESVDDSLFASSSRVAIKRAKERDELCSRSDRHAYLTSNLDAFVAALEIALESHLAKAKKLVLEDSIAAKKEFEKCKPYQAHLEKASELRNIPGVFPPKWNWQLVQKQRAKVIESTKEDEVALEIVSVDGLQVDGGYINVQYDLGYIRGDEAEACRGKTDPWVTLEKPGARPGRAAQLGYRMVHPLARKSRATQLAFRNRRATFEVYYRKKKGWLAPKPELFGKAVLPLVGLLHSCELEEQLRLRSGHRASSLAVLYVKLSIRTPLSGEELVWVEEKQLTVGEWPTSTIPKALVINPNEMKTDKYKEEDQDTRLKIHGMPQQKSRAAEQESQLDLAPQQAATGGAPDFGILTEKEKYDPFAPECIDSNDVLEAEIAANQGATDAQSIARQSGLVLKLECLVSAVQQEELTIEKYCEILTDRMTRDKILAVWLKREGRVQEALRIMGRIKVMENELASADG